MTNALKIRSAFDGLLPKAAPDAGVLVVEVRNLRLVSLTARKARAADIRHRVKSTLGIDLTDGPCGSSGSEVIFLGTSPGAWLARIEGADAEFEAHLSTVVGTHGSLIDLSAAYGVLQLSGPQVRSALSRLVPLDLHPTAFPVSRCAATLVSHIPVVVWRPRFDTYEFLVPRSYAASFFGALATAASPLGFAQPPPGGP